MIFDKDKGFAENAKDILKRYPKVIKDSWKSRRQFSLLSESPQEDSMATRILRTLFSVIFYFPLTFIFVGVELYTGVPIHETDFDRLERLERTGQKLTDREKVWLDEKRAWFKVQRARAKVIEEIDKKRAEQQKEESNGN